MQVLSRSTSSPWLIRLAALLLCFSVFNCGLQARLASPNVHSSGVRQSFRLCTEKWFGNTGELYELPLDRLLPAHLVGQSWLTLLFRGRQVQSPEPRQVELSLWGPRRYDSLGAYRLQLPPPFQA